MTLNLKGELICDEWAEVYRHFGYTTGYYCPMDIGAAIEALEPEEPLTLIINSVGGDVDAAAEIYSMIERCKNPTTAEIHSIAASAASYLALAADHVAISMPAQMMIHCASMSGGGNKFDHQWAAQQLDTVDMSILDTYCKRCGEERRDELRELMEHETYLTATQCLALGLVDSIIGGAESDGEPVNIVACASRNVVRAMRTLPDIRDLTARMQSEKSAMAAELRAEMERYQ